MTTTTRPRLEFFGAVSLALDVLEIAHDACEREAASCAPQFPHREDSVLVGIDVVDGDGRDVQLVIATEREHVGKAADQFEALARTLRGIGTSWKRVGVCATCSKVGFNADTPPPQFQCEQCSDTRFSLIDLEEGAGALRSVAGGDARASLGRSCGEAVRP